MKKELIPTRLYLISRETDTRSSLYDAVVKVLRDAIEAVENFSVILFVPYVSFPEPYYDLSLR